MSLYASIPDDDFASRFLSLAIRVQERVRMGPRLLADGLQGNQPFSPFKSGCGQHKSAQSWKRGV